MTAGSTEEGCLAASFGPIEAFARIMAGFPQPWYVAGGWAIDLFGGRVTRAHEDLEVAVCRRDLGALSRAPEKLRP